MNRSIDIKHLFLLFLLLFTNSVFSQSVKQEKMEQLSFLVGEWIGTSKIFEDGVVTKQGSAYEKISYDLDKSILVIELNSEMLQLHTIVNYDEKDETYYYNPFSKRGAARYPAEFRDGQLIVSANEKTRFIFGSTPEGGFREYGEKWVEGKWIKYFEDVFVDSQ